MSLIHELIPKISARIPAIGKDQKNIQQGYKFRGIDDMCNQLQPILSEFGVTIWPEVISTVRETRVTKSGGNLYAIIHTVRYHIVASDGSEVAPVVVGEGADSGDKASNKAMTSAFKYVLIQTFMMRTDDIEDGDRVNPEEERHDAQPVSPVKSNSIQAPNLGKYDAKTQLFRTLFAIGKENLWTNEMIAEYSKKRFNILSRAELTIDQIKEVIETVKTYSYAEAFGKLAEIFDDMPDFYNALEELKKGES